MADMPQLKDDIYPSTYKCGRVIGYLWHQYRHLETPQSKCEFADPYWIDWYKDGYNTYQALFDGRYLINGNTP